MKATWRGRTIAESNEIIEVDGYFYFPRDAVRMDLLTMSPRTASDDECPHGVQFYDLGDAGEQSARAAWSYEAPRASMKRVDHLIAFWQDVQLT